MKTDYCVCCLNSNSEIQKSYRSESLLYAKRYADLYKENYYLTEIRQRQEDGTEQVIECFRGKCPEERRRYNENSSRYE